MNSKQLQYAIELSETLNFSQVAEKFNISQPALSKQISSLEKDLGVTLFDRKKNPIALTAAGEYFFKHAKELVYKEKQLYRSMEKFSTGEMGRLSIGISPFRSLYLIPKICKKITQKYPGVKIVLQEAGSDILKRNASDGKYDFAIVNLPVDESAFDVINIEKDKLVLAVPANMQSLLQVKETGGIPQIDFACCENLPFVVVGQHQEMRQIFEKNCTVANINPKIAMEVVGLSTAWSMVRAGIGATLLPLEFINEISSDDSVKLFIPKCDTNIRQPVIITKRGQYISEYAEYAIKLLTEK